MDRSKKNPKNESSGLFTSHGAVQSKAADAQVKSLYFTTTASGDFQKWDCSRDDSLGEVYQIGHKSTKNLQFQYRQTPTHDMGALSYTKDYTKKTSDAGLNNALAEIFSRPHNAWVGSPTVAPGSYALDFTRHRKQCLNALGEPGKAGGRGGAKRDMARTKVLSPSDLTHETSSSTHRCYLAPPEDMYRANESMHPNDNLGISGLDSGDCYKSTYGTTFRGMSRCHTAPANMSRKEANDLQKDMARTVESSVRTIRPSTSSGSERRRSIRNIYTRTGS